MPKFLGYEFDLFGFLKTDEKPVAPILNEPNDDGSKIIEVSQDKDGAGVFFTSGTTLNYDSSFQDEKDLIKKYRNMAFQPEVDEAINDIVVDSIVGDEREDTVKVDLQRTEWSKSIQKKVSEEFSNVLDILEFRGKGFEIFKSWYIDGRIFYQKVPHKNRNKGLHSVKRLDSLNIKKVKEITKKTDKKTGVEYITGVKEYYVYSKQSNYQPGYTSMRGNVASNIKIPLENIAYAHSGLFDSEKEQVLSHLHKAMKTLNQLLMLEDSVVIYRISRAPERRVFYIDVGNLPRTKAEQYLQDIMRRFRNKLVYDSSSGEVKDDRKFTTMTEDYWLPRREGKTGTSIETLPAGSNLGEMEDVEYFKKKLYKALNIPTSRLEQETAFNMGRSGEITRDEVKFAKFVDRLRRRFSDIFYDLLSTQLIMKGVMSREEWNQNKDRIEFVYSNNSYFSELKTMELLRERFTLATEAESYIGEYFSRKWMYNNVFKFSDAEIAAMKKEIDKEQNSGEITPDDFGNAGSDLSSSSGSSSPTPQRSPQQPEPYEQTVLDESDVTFNNESINNTKTVSQLLERMSKVLDEE
tara:strand:+ start:4645 stop:6378 length:1734 start_codon:yes stop_codon:yes gene_type:complete